MANQREKREEREGRVSARRQAQEQRGGFERTAVRLPDGVVEFTADGEGPFTLDFIPYRVPKGANNPWCADGKLHYERTYYTHRGIGAGENTYVCPAKTFGKKCPICEARAAEARKSAGDKDLIKALVPKDRQLWYLVNGAEKEKGLQLWDISFHLFGKQLNKRIRDAEEDMEYEFFADPTAGKTLRVGFTEKVMPGSKFFEAATIDFKNRGPVDPEILKLASDNPLDSLLICLPYEKLRDIYYMTGGGSEESSGGEQGSADDGFQEETPKKPQTQATAAPKKDPPKAETAAPKKEPPKQSAPAACPYKKGDEVVHPDFGPCRILKVSGDGTSLTLTDFDDEVHTAVAPAEVRPKKQKSATEAPKTTPKEASEATSTNGSVGDDDWETDPATEATAEGGGDSWDEDWDEGK